MIALYLAWEEPLAKEPEGVYLHDGGRPMLGRKIKGESQCELRSLGLVVEDDDLQVDLRRTVPASADGHDQRALALELRGFDDSRVPGDVGERLGRIAGARYVTSPATEQRALRS